MAVMSLSNIQGANPWAWKIADVRTNRLK